MDAVTSTEPTRAKTQRPVLFDPRSAVSWLFGGTVAAGSLRLLTIEGSVLQETMRANLMLAPLLLAVAVFMVWLMLCFDPFRAMRPYPQALVAGMAIGALSAAPMSIDGNMALVQLWSKVLPPDVLAAWSVALTAPFLEEIAKTLCATVLLVLGAAMFTRISHALLIGMFVGFGFDVMEDLGFASYNALMNLDSDIAGAREEWFLRIFTAAPAHWSYTSLTAAGVMVLLPSFAGRTSWPTRRRLLVGVGLLLSGPLLHFSWNTPVPADLLLPLVLTKLVVGVSFYLLIVFALLRVERRWVIDRIAAGRADRWLADIRPEVLDSLPTYRRRRALRHAARSTGGHPAATSVKAEQNAALDRIQGHSS